MRPASLHSSTLQCNTAVSPRGDLQRKRCCFSHCGQGEGYCFKGGRAGVYRTKGVHHPSSLSLLCLSTMCGPRGSLQLERSLGLESMRGWSVWRRLLWSEVHHWHDPSASLRPGSPLQPWQRPLPAATHTELSVEECIRPEDTECNTIVLGFFICG